MGKSSFNLDNFIKLYIFESTPWILLTGSHEVGFNWMTTQPANSWLEYRQDTNSEWKVSYYAKYGLKDANTLYHRAYVKDYDPKKPIWYRFVGREVIKFQSFTAKFHPEVRSEEGMLKPVVREDGSWTAAVFQDVHSQNDMYEPLLKLVKDWNFMTSLPTKRYHMGFLGS